MIPTTMLALRVPIQLRRVASATSVRLLTVSAVRHLSQATDPIQKLFVDKIREYKQKQQKAGSAIVDAGPEVEKALDGEMKRVLAQFGMQSEADITNIKANFPDTCELDDINMVKRN